MVNFVGAVKGKLEIVDMGGFTPPLDETYAIARIFLDVPFSGIPFRLVA